MRLPSKAFVPIDVTVFGKVTEYELAETPNLFKFMQFLKAPFPIVVSPVPEMFTSIKFEQPKNAFAPIDVIVEGRLIIANHVAFWKTLLFIALTVKVLPNEIDDGIVKVTNDPDIE